MEAVNVFYFGSDNRQDGINLGAAFRDAYPDRNRLLVLDVAQSSARTEAFLSVCQDMIVVQRIELPLLQSYYGSSYLARRIAAEVTEPFDSVYCSTGILPSVCLALDKLKIDPNVICIGYENPPSNAVFWQNGRIGLTLCQDIAAQSKACADAVAKLYFDRYFPDRKYNYLDSHILFPPRNASKE